MTALYKIHQKDCLEWLHECTANNVVLTFFDPPFNQGKEYRFFNDAQPEKQYWNWLSKILD